MAKVDPLRMRFQDSDHQGPADPSHPMHRSYPSPRWIWFLCLYGAAAVVLSLAMIGLRANEYFGIQEQAKSKEQNQIQQLTAALAELTKRVQASAENGRPAPGASAESETPQEPPADQQRDGGQGNGERRSQDQTDSEPGDSAEGQDQEEPDGSPTWKLFIIAVFAGSLGGSVHLLSSLSRFIGARRFLKSWIPFYLLLPFMGAALGASIFFFIQAGLATTQPGLEPIDQNPYSILLFCTLAGLFSRQALDKLAEVFENFFRTEESSQPASPVKEAPVVGSADTGNDASAPLPANAGEVPEFGQQEKVKRKDS